MIAARLSGRRRTALIAACAFGLGHILGLVLSSSPADAVDLVKLDTPGAVHLLPAAASTSRAPISAYGVPPVIAPAVAAIAPAIAVTVPAVRMTGLILPGDADKMRALLDTLVAMPESKGEGPLTTIELSSLGGNLIEGFQIGALLRKYNVIAVVRKRDLCLSSCALALLGGNPRNVPPAYPTHCNVEIGGKVGFHNFFLNPAGLRETTTGDPVASRLQGFADARGGAASLVRYAAEIGLPPKFVASLMGRPVDDFQYIETVEQFLALGVCPIGLPRPTTPLGEQAGNVCLHSMGLADSAPAVQVRPLAAAQAKRTLLEVLQAHMPPARSQGKLARMLTDGSIMRVPEEIDRLYEELQAASVPLPDIVGPTFEVSIGSAAKAEVACYVSLSADNPDGYDVVTLGPKGLADPPHLPPQNARGLFLYASDTVINRRP